MVTRTSDILLKFAEDTECEVIFKKCGPLDFSKCVQIPSKKEVIERYYTIKNGLPQNEPTSTSFNKLSEQLFKEWVNMNIPAVQCKNIAKHHLEPLIQKMKKLQKTAKSKRKDKWHSEMKSFIRELDNGLDIMAKDEDAKDLTSDELGIEFG